MIVRGTGRAGSSRPLESKADDGKHIAAVLWDRPAPEVAGFLRGVVGGEDHGVIALGAEEVSRRTHWQRMEEPEVVCKASVLGGSQART